MSQEGQKVSSYAGEQSYHPFTDSYVALRIMPERLMSDIERLLSNRRYELQKVDGQLVEVEKKLGTPLCNEEGINSILNLIRMRVNEHTVQGNFTMEQYNNYTADMRIEINEAIIINADNWQIKDNSIEMITNSIMGLARPFLTRLIDNLERESLKSGVQTKETVVREANRDDKQGWARV